MMAVRWACWLLAIATPISALRTVHGSPCTDVCGTTTNTTSDEVACLDADFNSTIGTAVGKNFKSCVSCLLSSPYQNTTIGETDVNWGLCTSLICLRSIRHDVANLISLKLIFLTVNLRYAFSSCVYDYPVSVTNVSTPCLVSCTSLGPALDMALTDPTGNQLSTFCSSTSFADNVVTTCENCYALTSQQSFFANCMSLVAMKTR